MLNGFKAGKAEAGKDGKAKDQGHWKADKGSEWIHGEVQRGGH